MGRITQLPSDSAPTINDAVPIVDSTSNATRRVTLLSLYNTMFANYAANTAGTPAWTTWTPNFQGLGSHTVDYAKYIQLGSTIIFRIQVSITAAATGQYTFTPPKNVNAEVSAGANLQSISTIYDASATTFYGATCLVINSSTIGVYYMPLTGSVVKYVATSATLPVTLANPDKLLLCGMYEV